MDKYEVFRRFVLIANLSEEEAEKWKEICYESADEIEAQLSGEILEKRETRKLNAAAAALSFYKYILYKYASEDSKTIGLGDVPAKNDVKQIVNIARIIWENARASVENLLGDVRFRAIE